MSDFRDPSFEAQLMSAANDAVRSEDCALLMRGRALSGAGVPLATWFLAEKRILCTGDVRDSVDAVLMTLAILFGEMILDQYSDNDIDEAVNRLVSKFREGVRLPIGEEVKKTV